MTSTTKITIAVSARALFDFETENQLFQEDDPSAYCALQATRLDVPASPGVAFPLVRKLLAFNSGGNNDVEVAILSRNDPVTGLRVFTSARHHGLAISRAIFTSGAKPHRYLAPLEANLFLSAHAPDVREAMSAGFPAAGSTRFQVWLPPRTTGNCASRSTETRSFSATRPSASSKSGSCWSSTRTRCVTRVRRCLPVR